MILDKTNYISIGKITNFFGIKGEAKVGFDNVNQIKNAKSVLEASNIVLLQFERPANQSESVQAKRASYGQKYYDKFVKEDIEMAEIKKDNTPDAWAKEAVDWAVENKILFGDENGNYKLHDNCTRQEMLVFINRVCEKVLK